ncbi:MAG TPA: hypothetical protein ENM97_07240 [Moorella mulderi]|nr:hypothetical protein [Moorella mulderi]
MRFGSTVQETLQYFFEEGYFISNTEGDFLNSADLKGRLPGFEETPAVLSFTLMEEGIRGWDLDTYRPVALVVPASIENPLEAYRRGDARCYVIWAFTF